MQGIYFLHNLQPLKENASMALTDAEIGILSINLTKKVREFYLEKKQANESRYNFEIDDSFIRTMLLTTDTDSLDDKSPNGYSTLSKEDKHSVIERALAALTPGTGLTFDNPETGLWLRVAIAHEGRTPLGNIADYRMIRLSSIDQVIPKVGLGGGEDIRDNGWNLMVQTNNGDTFYASERTYRGNLINYPLTKLISAINYAVKAEIQLDGQPKPA
jgi:hypothetical protein